MSDRQSEKSGADNTLSGLLGTAAAEQAQAGARLLAAAGVEAMMSTVSPVAGAAAGAAARYALESMHPGILPSVIPNSFKNLFNDLRYHLPPSEENSPRSLQDRLSPVNGSSENQNGSPATKLAEGAVLTGAAAVAKAAGQEAGRTEKQIKDLANQVINEIKETPDDVLKHIKENPVTSIIEGSLWIPSIVVDAKLRKYFGK